MSTSGLPASPSVTSWTEIRHEYPELWVCIVDVERESSGALRAGRVVAHDPSLMRLLDRVEGRFPDGGLIHTSGRPLRRPRLQMTDEIRDLIRHHR